MSSLGSPMVLLQFRETQTLSRRTGCRRGEEAGSLDRRSDGCAHGAVQPVIVQAVRTQLPFINGVLHASNTTGDPRNTDDGAAGFGAGNVREHNLFRGPTDVLRRALIPLAAGSLMNALQAVDGMHDFREVGQKELVVLELRFDGVEHVRSVIFVDADLKTITSRPSPYCFFTDTFMTAFGLGT